MSLVVVQKREPLGHPRVEASAGVLGDLAHHVRPVLEPLELAARRNRKDRDLAVLALVTVLHQGLRFARRRAGPAAGADSYSRTWTVTNTWKGEAIWLVPGTYA